MSALNTKIPEHHPPLIVPPQLSHITTLIILHGRGSTAQKFANPLLNHAVSSSSKPFKDHFPHTRFVFPTAPLRRAIAFNRSLIHQWFDNWSLTEPGVKQHVQIQGLRETTIFLHDLLREEIKLVGPRNVVLMGLSQGCAASIVATILWRGEPFGGLVGMCGYLPFRKGMCDAAEEEHKTGELVEEDVFEREDGDAKNNATRFEKAVEWLREELEIYEDDSKEMSAMQSIPVFMGHGTEDEKVPRGIGRMAAKFLGSIDVDTVLREYQGVAHWYSEDMLGDVVVFLKGLEGCRTLFDGLRKYSMVTNRVNYIYKKKYTRR